MLLINHQSLLFFLLSFHLFPFYASNSILNIIDLSLILMSTFHLKCLHSYSLCYQSLFPFMFQFFPFFPHFLTLMILLPSISITTYPLSLVQVPAQHTWKGIFNLLIDPNDLQAKELRKRYVFKIIPLLNPDGEGNVMI